jgi:hypothetical protein
MEQTPGLRMKQQGNNSSTRDDAEQSSNRRGRNPQTGLGKRPKGSRAAKRVTSNSLVELRKGMEKVYKEEGFDFVKVNVFGSILVVSMLDGNTAYVSMIIQDSTKGFTPVSYADALKERRKTLPKTIVDIFDEPDNDSGVDGLTKAKERIKEELSILYKTDIKKVITFVFSSNSGVELDDEAIALRADFAFNPPYYRMLTDRGENIDESIQSMIDRQTTAGDRNNEFKLEFFQVESDSYDINDIPVRTDFSIDVLAPRPEEVGQLFDGDDTTLVTTSGYINLIPAEYEETSRSGRVIEDGVGFGAQIIVNDIMTSSMTLGENLIGVASAIALHEEYNWVKPLLAHFDDIKELNKMAEIKFAKSDTPASVITSVVNLGAALAVDFHIFGTNIINGNALSTAAGITSNYDQKSGRAVLAKAEKDIFDTLDNITDGIFYEEWSEGSMFVDSQILPVGYYYDNENNKVSLDTIDAAYIIRNHPKNFLTYIDAYLDAITGAYSYDAMIELYADLGINAHIVSKKIRAIVNPDTISDIVSAITEAGLSPELDDPYIVDNKPGLGATKGYFSKYGLKKTSFTSRSKRGRSGRRKRSFRDSTYR